MSKLETNKAIVGRWFTEFWGKDVDLSVVDDIAAPDVCRHPELVKPHLPLDVFTSQILRPTGGIVLYAVAAALGWFTHPLIAVAIFVLVVAYYA